MIQAAVMVCRGDIDDKSTDLVLQLDASHHWIRADAVRLEQVFWNVLRNAVKFTPEGGRVSTRSQNHGDRVSVDVEDTGIGMKPEILKKIFHPFVQADKRIARQYGGLGLGLSIAKTLTELHGGMIWACSEGEGKGTTVTVELPFVE